MALSSTASTSFRLALRLPRTTRRDDFDLIALRARCTANVRDTPPSGKRPRTEEVRAKCEKSRADSSYNILRLFPFNAAARLRFVLS